PSSRMERVGGAGIEPATLGLSGHREKTASPRSSAGSSAGRGLDEARYVDRVRRRATEVDGLPGTPQDESHSGMRWRPSRMIPPRVGLKMAADFGSNARG